MTSSRFSRGIFSPLEFVLLVPDLAMKKLFPRRGQRSESGDKQQGGSNEENGPQGKVGDTLDRIITAKEQVSLVLLWACLLFYGEMSLNFAISAFFSTAKLPFYDFASFFSCEFHF